MRNVKGRQNRKNPKLYPLLLKLADVVIDSYTSLNFELPDMIVLPGGLKGAVSTPN
jgi:hypothetical protein